MHGRDLKTETLHLLGAVAGTFLYAAGMNFFVVPLNLYSSGLMGICQLLRTMLANVFHINFGSLDIAGLIYYAMSVPLMVMAFRTLGKFFSFKSFVCMTTMAFFLSVVPIPQHSLLSDDILTSAIIGGLISGVGSGLTLRMGGSGGGMDIISLYCIRKKGSFSVGKITLAVNIVVYGVCLFVFDISLVLYSLIYAAVYSLALDKLHVQNINMEVTIITKTESHFLEQAVLKEFGRGMTRWDAMGEYTKEGVKVLYIVLSKYEYYHLRRLLHQYDPHAFVVAKEISGVEGNYLKKLL